jgi:hypothetical protein
MIIFAKTRSAKILARGERSMNFRGLNGGRSAPLQSAELLRQGKRQFANT